MKKITRNIWMLFALVSVLIVSCKEDDTEVSTIASYDKFDTQFSEPITVTEPEGAEETTTVTITFSEKQIMDLNLSVSVSAASTATEGADFDLATHDLSVQALARQGSIDVVVYGDADPEGDETIVLSVQGVDVFGFPKPAEAVVIIIKNRAYPTDLLVSWDNEYSDSAGVHSMCDAIDIDLFLLDSNGDYAGGFGGATGNCPEMMTPGSLPDGTYSIVVNLYDNGALGATDLEEAPINMLVLLAKPGVLLAGESTIFYHTADFNQVPLWTTFTPSDPDGLANATIGTVRVAGGKVTLVNPAGVDVGEL